MGNKLVEKQALLAWSLLFILLLLSLMFAVVPALSYSSELSDRIESGYRKLVKFRQIANTTPEFMAEYERVRSQGLDKLFYSQGMTSAQVAKDLQAQLMNLIRRGGGILVSSEVLDEKDAPEKSYPGYEKVTVRAVFQGKTTLLRQVLHQPYQARPLIFLDSLEVRPLDEGDLENQEIKAEVKVTTYWRSGNPTPNQNGEEEGNKS